MKKCGVSKRVMTRRFGVMVDDPQQFPSALQGALKVVKEEKRQAALNVICGSH